MTKLTLNQGQTEAKNAMLDFLADDTHKFFCLMGPAGTGKTTVLSQVEGDLQFFNKQRKMFGLPEYTKLEFTATTNKASSLFGQAKTIHKLLGLRPTFNKVGQKVLEKSMKSCNIANAIIVVDEASMIDEKLYGFIDELTQGSKVVFLLDPNQLPPVGYDKAYVSDQGFPESYLTEPMRQDKDSHLYKVCDRLRNGVIDQLIMPIDEGVGIRHIEGEQLKQEITDAFKAQESCRVLAFSNKQVEAFNHFIRSEIKNRTHFGVGDLVVAANVPTDSMIHVEGTYRLTGVDMNPVNFMGLRCYTVEIAGQYFKVPFDKEQYFQGCKRLQREAKRDRQWRTFYKFKEGVLDIRDAYACTVHSSQGSTYDKVFIDYEDLCQCRDINTFVRLLYVAVSRAKYEVVLYGL